MCQYDSISRHPRNFYPVTLLLLLGLSACATTPSPDEIIDSTTNNTPKTVAKTVDNPQSNNSTTATKPTDTEPTARETNPVDPESATQEPVTSLAETEQVTPPTKEIEQVSIDISCKNSPYSKYEEQARISIAKGLSATSAGTYGVGFRHLDEHKKWSKTHKILFTTVNQTCSTLSKCIKQHPKDKTTQCANQAKQFDEWQNLAARFAEKAKQSETTQPPKICSFIPDLDDAANCFHSLADNIDNACTTGDCKKTSDCWRSIGFLDGVINQAASACTFVHTPLAECGGYLTATQRRKNKFERCAQMQEGLNMRIIPVL